MKLAENFETRLRSWVKLRDSLAELDTQAVCTAVNSWWFQRPWRPYRLHWDDRPTWPDPWALLEETAFCDLARGLGIMYTITMLDRDDLQDCVLYEDQTHNLVLVRAGKYILNYSSDDILNTCLETDKSKIRRAVTQAELKRQIN